MIENNSAPGNPPLRLGLVAKSGYFHDYRRKLIDVLPESGIYVEMLESIPTERKRFDIVLVIGIHEHMRPSLLRDYLLVGIQTEQLPCSPTQEFRILRNLKRFRAIRDAYDHLFEWSPGIYCSGVHRNNVSYLPHGCDISGGPREELNYDLLFLGNLPGTDNRRERLLNRLKNRYRVHPDTYAWGDEKTTAIRQSAICLNIHYYATGGFESPRIFDYLALHAFVISERSDECFPFTSGKDLIEYDNEDTLFRQIDHYLANPGERDQVSRNGFQTASQYTFDKVFRRFALEIHRLQKSHRASPAEIAGRFLSASRIFAFEGRDKLSQIKHRFAQVT